jgi:G3E family GTPase
LRFDRVLIETTGLAAPGPVAQTFIVNLDVARQYRLDAVITVVDAKHGDVQLDQHMEARAQVGFADRLLLSKTDLVDEQDAQALTLRLKRINPRARLTRVHFGDTELADILDVRGFDLDSILELDPGFLEHDRHHHDDDVGSFVFRDPRPLDAVRFDAFMGLLLEQYGADLLRYKGVLNFEGRDRRMVFQGVHAVMGAQPGGSWMPGDTRETVLVFIGRKLPRGIIEEGLRLCLAAPAAR